MYFPLFFIIFNYPMPSMPALLLLPSLQNLHLFLEFRYMIIDRLFIDWLTNVAVVIFDGLLIVRNLIKNYRFWRRKILNKQCRKQNDLHDELRMAIGFSNFGFSCVLGFLLYLERCLKRSNKIKKNNYWKDNIHW